MLSFFRAVLRNGHSEGSVIMEIKVIIDDAEIVYSQELNIKMFMVEGLFDQLFDQFKKTAMKEIERIKKIEEKIESFEGKI